ncbi:unnamed protein product, partial [Rotaria sp. Silwood1]
AMSKYGIRFNSSPIEKFDAAVPQTILARMNELNMQEYEVIIYILDQVGDDISYLIKYFGNIKIGMVTHCIRFDQLVSNSDPREMDMYIQNLVEKFNARLRGVNQLVSLMPALKSPSARSDIFMFFGIDCTHITCSQVRPSIVAVVGLKDSTNTQYAALGLDDGSFEKVLDNELRAIQRACQELYGHNQLPQICFVVVKKRHHTRFFTWNKQSNQANNIQPGTVIDTDMVSLNGFEFYLNSDATIQGTSRPMLYQVLYDEIGFTSDDIQQLTYYLCHIDVRCTKAIYVPAPVHYATLHVSHHLKLHYKSQMVKDMNEINHVLEHTCLSTEKQSQLYSKFKTTNNSDMAVRNRYFHEPCH